MQFSPILAHEMIVEKPCSIKAPPDIAASYEQVMAVKELQWF